MADYLVHGVKNVIKIMDALSGLVTELLSRLSNAAGPSIASGTQGTPGKASSTTNAAANMPDPKATAASVSTIISLLSTLCRGSPAITHVRVTYFDVF